MLEMQFSIYWFLFSFSLLIRITHLTFHDSGHGFMTKKSRYFDDELSQIHEEIGSLKYFQNAADALSSLNLRFQPEILDFRDRTLGTPHSKTVTLFNTDSNKSIDLTSISGNTVHFHSSFFEDKQIPPNGNTSFKVVYLGRQEGPVESTLFLHTSGGFVKYNVKAIGTFNTYRVRPIVGVKLPVNSTFTPIIYMHNPHSEPIQIVEIYSSGGGFHLELPTGQHEGSNDLWEINPHETKAVIRVRFEATFPHNHTAYIRIKLHNPDEILIVPLEVEVTSNQNIFHPQGLVDFGIGGSMDDPKEINLCLLNPFKRAVRIHSVSTLSKSIKTQYYNIRINSANNNNDVSNKCVNVGTLTVDWKNAWRNHDYHGKIIVKFRNGKNRTEIPYFLTVLKGGLSYDKMSTTYFLNDKDMDTKERKFEVFNEFFLPVRVQDVKFPFDMDTTFKVQIFTPLDIRPFEKKRLFRIWLKSSARKTDMQLTSHIKILTNVSEINVPLLSYNGKLQIHLPFPSDDRSLNVGLIGFNKKVHLLFTLTNQNPVDIPLMQLSTSLAMNELQLYGCGTGDHKHILMYNALGNLTKCDKIGAQGYAVIKMTISTSDTAEHVKGDIFIQTPYENLSLPVYYKVSYGEMIIDHDDLIFKNCFPTKICYHPLRIFSSFSDKMFVENILTLPPDRRVSAAITSSILPKVNKIIGYMYYNPDLDCSPECYTGFVGEGSASWLRTLVVAKQVSDYDMKLVNTFYNRYLNFTENGLKSLTNISLRLDTSEVKGQMFVSKIHYLWPSLVRSNLINFTLDFPLTQVRNSSHKTLMLQNPANHSIVIQLIFEHDYPHAEMLYDGLPGSFIPPSQIKYTSVNWFSFDRRLMDVQQKYFWENLRLNAYKQSLPLILLPGQYKRINLEFTAEEARPYSSLLIIRNNLTILEIVRLNGKGTIPRFEFATLSPGDQKPLQFQISERQLRTCNPDYNQTPFLPALTVQESFLARNLGEIPVHVTSFSINGFPCEGFGFKVLNCEPFSLQPNSSKRIDLAFTPDLTMQEISRVLILGTSLNTFVNYSLKATVSRSYCRHCTGFVDRPTFENAGAYFGNVFAVVMVVILFGVGLVEANCLRERTEECYKASSCPSTSALPVLDLRKIGRQVREEIQSNGCSTTTTTTPVISESPAKVEVKPEEAQPSTESAASVVVPNNNKVEIIVKSEPAIIPTTGRKKLSQRTTNTDENRGEFRLTTGDEDLEKSDRIRERQKKKDILFERHRLKSRERKTEKELKLLEDKGKKEKHAQQNKDNNINNSDLNNRKPSSCIKKPFNNHKVIPSVEIEESSSTTTESSNTSSANCDDVDKENQRQIWPTKRNKTNKTNLNVTSNLINTSLSVNSKNKEAQQQENNNKIKHVSFVNNKLLRTKNHKAIIANNNDNNEQEAVFVGEKNASFKSNYGYSGSTIINSKEKRRRDLKFKDRNKEKLIFRYKNCCSDRKQSYENDPADNLVEKETSPKPSLGFYVSLPPVTTSCTTWCESKAKFSDVVARSEPSNDPSPVSTQSSESPEVVSYPSADEPERDGGSIAKNPPSPFNFTTNNTKPTMFVEPYKPIDLGPIGSKRLGTPESISPELFNHQDVSPFRSGNVTEFNPMNDQSVIAAVANNTFLSGAANSSFFTPPVANLINEELNIHPLNNWPINRTQQPSSVFRDSTIIQADEEGVRNFLATEVEEDSWRKLPTNDISSNNAENPTYWSNTFSNVLNTTTTKPSANNSAYLWGSNPIWEPWTPSAAAAAAPESPIRRTPPGFDEQIRKQKKKEEQIKRYQQQNNSNNSYGHPFGGCSHWKEPWE